MPPLTKREQRIALRGWIKWTLPLAIVFSVLFFDVRLNAHKLRDDYEIRDLRQQKTALDSELQALHVQEAGLQEFGRLDKMAIELGLKEPKPHQIVVIRGPAQASSPRHAAPFALAAAEAQQEIAPNAPVRPSPAQEGLE